MRQVSFTKDAFHENNQWFDSDIKLITRIQELIKDIDHEHRLVYSVTETQNLIIKCTGHD